MGRETMREEDAKEARGRLPSHTPGTINGGLINVLLVRRARKGKPEKVPIQFHQSGIASRRRSATADTEYRNGVYTPFPATPLRSSFRSPPPPSRTIHTRHPFTPTPHIYITIINTLPFTHFPCPRTRTIAASQSSNTSPQTELSGRISRTTNRKINTGQILLKLYTPSGPRPEKAREKRERNGTGKGGTRRPPNNIPFDD